MSNGRRPKIVLVVTVPEAVRHFLRPHIELLALSSDVTICCNLGRDTPPDDLRDLDVRWVNFDIRRSISLAHDALALMRLTAFLRRLRPDLVHTLLPKSGLVGMIASSLARVPLRFHTFTGQVWATKRGIPRLLLKNLDRLVGRLATAVITDSRSQSEFLMSQNVVKQATVFGSGSICGVDCDRFRPSPERRASSRAAWAIGKDAFVVGFVGRLNRDKGVYDLVEAFATAALPPDSRLILVGPDEENVVRTVQQHWPSLCQRILFVGPVADVSVVLPAFDLFCLPSYREGFGSAVIEASACGLPVLTSRIYGLTDAVEERVTGWHHPAGDISAIRMALEYAYHQPTERQEYGRAGRNRAKREFRTERIVRERQYFYDKLLGDVA